MDIKKLLVGAALLLLGLDPGQVAAAQDWHPEALPTRVISAYGYQSGGGLAGALASVVSTYWYPFAVKPELVPPLRPMSYASLAGALGMEPAELETQVRERSGVGFRISVEEKTPRWRVHADAAAAGDAVAAGHVTSVSNDDWDQRPGDELAPNGAIYPTTGPLELVGLGGVWVTASKSMAIAFRWGFRRISTQRHAAGRLVCVTATCANIFVSSVQKTTPLVRPQVPLVGQFVRDLDRRQRFLRLPPPRSLPLGTRRPPIK